MNLLKRMPFCLGLERLARWGFAFGAEPLRRGEHSALRWLEPGRHFIFLIVLVCGLGASPILAGSMGPLSVEELTARADFIFQGMVLSKSCLKDAAGQIYTRTELQLTDVWKGAAASGIVSVVQGGGILGERRTAVFGQVEYQLDEEVVVFARRTPAGELVTVGMAQGKFGVRLESGRKYVSNLFHGGTGPKGGSALEGRRVSAKLTLTELKARVQEAVR